MSAFLGLDHGAGHLAYRPSSRGMGLNVGFYARKIVYSGKINYQVHHGGAGGEVL